MAVCLAFFIYLFRWTNEIANQINVEFVFIHKSAIYFGELSFENTFVLVIISAVPFF